MTNEAAAKYQSNTKSILKAKDIVTGKIALTEITEPYLFIYDDTYGISVNNEEEEEKDHLVEAVKIILANKMGYRLVTPCYMGIISDRVVCMVKIREEEEDEEEEEGYRRRVQ